MATLIRPEYIITGLILFSKPAAGMRGNSGLSTSINVFPFKHGLLGLRVQWFAKFNTFLRQSDLEVRHLIEYTNSA